MLKSIEHLPKGEFGVKMEKRTFRIGELAAHLDVECFVIRFWEKEFDVVPQRSLGGQRYYTDLEIQKFLLIKDLLYHKKFTIAGAKRHIEYQSNKPKYKKLTLPSNTPLMQHPVNLTRDFYKKIHALQKKLKRLRALL